MVVEMPKDLTKVEKGIDKATDKIDKNLDRADRFVDKSLKVAGQEIDKFADKTVKNLEDLEKTQEKLGSAFGFVKRAIKIIKTGKNAGEIATGLAELSEQAQKHEGNNKFIKTFGKLLKTVSKVFDMAAKGKKVGTHVEEVVGKEFEKVKEVGKGKKGPSQDR
jgi:hypothetical protein